MGVPMDRTTSAININGRENTVMRSLLLALICVSALQLAACDENASNPPAPAVVNAPAPPPQEKTPPTMAVPSSSAMPPATMPSDVTMPPTTQPNNTGINTRDRNAGALTAGQQSQSKSDIQLLANIRKQIMSANLSVTAQNVKIITQNGSVLLRGPVQTQSEKDTIGRIATTTAGVGNVDNELEVEPANPNNPNTPAYPNNQMNQTNQNP
jgi:hyperosmotically inducible protein